MKTKIKILFALVIMANFLIAQNLIRNSGFEIADPLTSGNVPSAPDQLEKCKYWKNFKTADWYTTKVAPMDNWGNYYWNVDCPYDISGSSILKTHDGSKFFAGFGQCEGVQTELISKIDKNNIVHLSFWYNIRTKGDGTPINTKINIYLMKNQELSIGGCGSSYSNSYRIQLDVSNPGYCEDWKHYETTFLSDDDNYDWLFFRGEGSDDGDGTEYIFLDDIELTSISSYCEHQCYPLQTSVAPEIIGNISDRCYINGRWIMQDGHYVYVPPWNITIKNTDYLKFTVFDRWGGIQYEKEIFDPNLITFKNMGQGTEDYYQFVWNGTDNSNAALTEDVYVGLINYENCHEKKESAVAILVVPDVTPIIPPSYPVNSFNYNCCETSITLNTSPVKSFSYQASENIEAGSYYNIGADKSITFKAGNNIKLRDGFKATRGCNFKATPNCTCNTLNLLMVNNHFTNDTLLSENKIELKPAGTESNIFSQNKNQKQNTDTSNIADLTHSESVNNVINTVSLFPNPSNGKFLIQINGSIPAFSTVELKDLFGKVIYSSLMNQSSKIIDIGKSSAGIYFITVCAGNDCWLGKVVKE